MSLTSETLSGLRRAALALTGLVCLAYAASALALERPDPFWPLLPVAMGLGSFLLIAVMAFVAGDPVATQSVDESYWADFSRATGLAFWIAVLLYPAFGFGLGRGWVTYDVAFSAMATLTPAAFLLLFVVFDHRGRA